MKKATVRTVAVSVVILVVLSGIVAVEAQTPANGQANANVIAQNMHLSDDAIVNSIYYNEDGSEADSIGKTIKSRSAKEFRISKTSIGDPWIGSMVLYSTKELATIVNLLWDGGTYGDGKTAACYTGFGETSDTWYLPRLAVYHGRQVSQIAVQNADTDSAKVWFRYYERGHTTPTAEVSVNIPAGGSRHYDLGSPGGKVPDLAGIVGSDWTGSAVVEAEGGRQITAMVVNQWQGTAAAHMGGIQPANNLVAPRLSRRGRDKPEGFQWLEFGQIVLQNPNSVAAAVDVAFYDRETGALDLLLDDLIIGGQKVLVLHLKNGGHVPASTFEVLDRVAGPDAGWNGQAVVTSNLPLFGVATDRRGLDAASQYNMFDVTQGSGTIYGPSVYRTLGSYGTRSRIAIANLTSEEATTNYYFYDRYGNVDLALPNRTIPGDCIDNLLLHTSLFDTLGDAWVGSFYMTSNKPVVAIVDTLWEGGFGRLGTYNAIND